MREEIPVRLAKKSQLFVSTVTYHMLLFILGSIIFVNLG
jgi:hypothetical protein